MKGPARGWGAMLAAALAVALAALAALTLQFYGSSVMQRALAGLGAFCSG